MTDTSTVFAQPGERLLKVSDVCERLQMGRAKVFDLIMRGELASLKIDNMRRVSEAQLAEFVARHAAASKLPA